MAPKNDPRDKQPWPPKQHGQHRWVAMIVYAITEQQAAAVTGGSIVNLGARIDSVIGCYDCDKPFTTARNTACTAEAKPTPE